MGRRREPVGELSSYYRWLAGRLAEGHRETPQRFRPLARRLARPKPDRDRIWRLFSFILRDQAAEFRENPALPDDERHMVDAMLLTVEEPFYAGFWPPMHSMCWEMEPMRRRRRSIHCHGVVAGSRALLVMRWMCSIVLSFMDPAEEYGEDSPGMARELELLLAYHVSGYDRDHFEMVGPVVARRMLRVALWCQFHVRGDGFVPGSGGGGQG